MPPATPLGRAAQATAAENGCHCAVWDSRCGVLGRGLTAVSTGYKLAPLAHGGLARECIRVCARCGEGIPSQVGCLSHPGRAPCQPPLREPSSPPRTLRGLGRTAHPARRNSGGRGERLTLPKDRAQPLGHRGRGCRGLGSRGCHGRQPPGLIRGGGGATVVVKTGRRPGLSVTPGLSVAQLAREPHKPPAETDRIPVDVQTGRRPGRHNLPASHTALKPPAADSETDDMPADGPLAYRPPSHFPPVTPAAAAAAGHTTAATNAASAESNHLPPL